MSEKKSKIVGTIFLIVLISCILYLSFLTTVKANKGKFEMIELTGNYLLSETDYLAFTRLTELSQYEDVKLPVIKDRFLKHPYVRGTEVEFNGINTVKVRVDEKSIVAILIGGVEPYFITDEFQIIPIFPNTKFTELPVISNPGGEKIINPLSILKNKEMVQAFKIIEAAKLTGSKIFKSLEEINLRNGGEILLTFSGINAPVIFGRGGEAKKMIYLEILWENLTNGSVVADNSQYIDLRFAEEVYVGMEVKV